MGRCHNCGQELIEIDNQGERLTGCLTCNLWAPAKGIELGQAFRGRSPRAAPVATWREEIGRPPKRAPDEPREEVSPVAWGSAPGLNCEQRPSALGGFRPAQIGTRKRGR